MPEKIAIIAALETELHPLIKSWPNQPSTQEHTFHESSYAVAVCGGIGAESARRASEAIIAKYSPDLLISAGVAGCPGPDLKVGETIFPATSSTPTTAAATKPAIQNAPVGNTPWREPSSSAPPKSPAVAQKQQLGKILLRPRRGHGSRRRRPRRREPTIFRSSPSKPSPTRSISKSPK